METSDQNISDPAIDQKNSRLPPDKTQGKTARRLRKLSLVSIVLAVVGVIFSWLAPQEPLDVDEALAHVLILLFGFMAICSGLSWCACQPDYPWYARYGPAVFVTAAILTFAFAFRIDNVSSTLVPEFRLRWKAAKDEQLAAPTTAKSRAPVDLRSTTKQDFPQFLGPQRTGLYNEIHLHRDWKTNPPVQLWRQDIGAGWSGFTVVNGFAVTMEQRGAKELVTCYATKTGTLLWSHSVTARHQTVLGGIGPRSTPLIHEGRVYALGATGILRCLDGATGAELWRDDLLKRYGVATPDEDFAQIGWGRANSPLVVDDLLVVPAGGATSNGTFQGVSLVAFDKLSGNLAWEAGTRQISYASPILGDVGEQDQIVIVNEDNVTGHNPETGRVLWELDWPGGSTSSANVSQAHLLAGDRLLLSKGYGGGARMLHLEKHAGGFKSHVVWSNKRVLKTKFTNVVTIDDHAYGLSDGVMECIDLKDGKRQWKRGRYGHGQILGVNDVLLVQTESGEIVMLEVNPKRHRELGSFEALADTTWNNLCLYGTLLLVRNAQEAACYRVALASADE
ncbi:MAG: PQQ-like beta-propeller repeat protein [Pirellulaceae bacterium]|nr:PQQ-like beta-propeller repeat protein [Pirellulaceae bacterium]